MTPNILCGLHGHQQQPASFAVWIRRKFVGTLGHPRRGSEIPGPAPMKTKSDGNSKNSESDGNNIDILPFWAVSQLSRGIWRALEGFRGF